MWPLKLIFACVGTPGPLTVSGLSQCYSPMARKGGLTDVVISRIENQGVRPGYRYSETEARAMGGVPPAGGGIRNWCQPPKRPIKL